MNDQLLKDLSALENKFGISIPNFYRNFLVNFPDEISEKAPVSTDDEDLEVGGCQMMLQSIQMLEDANVEFRAAIDTSESSIDPEEWFVTGFDGYGNYYLVSTKSDTEKIFFYEHEDGEISPRFSNLKSYLGEVNDYLDSNLDPDY